MPKNPMEVLFTLSRASGHEHQAPFEAGTGGPHVLTAPVGSLLRGHSVTLESKGPEQRGPSSVRGLT